MNHRILVCSSLVVVAVCLSACGQIGALYLPDHAPAKHPLPLSATPAQGGPTEQPQPTAAPAATPAPAAAQPSVTPLTGASPATNTVPQKETP